MLILYLAFFLIFIRRLPDVQAEINLWLVVCILSQIIAVPFGLNYFSAGMLIFIPLGIKFWFGKTAKLKEVLYAGLFALPFIAVTSMPTRFLDAGRYYDQTIRWLIHGVPKGIGNFELYLLQMSAAHSVEAAATTFISSGQNNFVSLISTFLIVSAFLKCKKNNLFFIVAAALLYLIAVHFAQTSSPGLLIFSLLFCLFFGIDKIEKIKTATIILIGITIPLIKITAAPISVLAALELLRRKSFSGLSAISFGGLLVIGKNVWTAGWIPGLGVLPLDWAVPEIAIHSAEDAFKISQETARGFYFEFFGFPMRLTTIISAVFFALFSWMYVRVTIRDTKVTLIKIIVILTVFLFWFFYYPNIRFLLPFYIVLLGLLYQNQLTLKTSNKTIYFIWLLSMVSILVNFAPFMPNERAKHFFSYSGIKNINLVIPNKSWQLKTESRTLNSNFTYHVPVDYFHCYDSKFPCTRNKIKYYGGSTFYVPKYIAEKNMFVFEECNEPETGKCDDSEQ